LLVCGCGRRLRTSYRDGLALYGCERHLREDKEEKCHGLPAAPIDELVASQVLRAIEPAALELSLKAMEDIQRERKRLHRHWKQRLERARYEAERIERQYQAVEPENRLVARTLEQRWEEVLREQRQLEEDYDRFIQEQPRQLSDNEQTRIKTLSTDLPALWNASTTTAKDRKEITRLLVERVAVQVRPDNEYVHAIIHWHGGYTTEHEIVRPVPRYELQRDHEQVRDRIVQWRHEGLTAAQIAQRLNAEGIRTPRLGSYSASLVTRFIATRGLNCEPIADEQLGANEWQLPDLARELRIPQSKLRHWTRHGWVQSRKTAGKGLWILWANSRELKRLRRLRAQSKRGIISYPASLTIPPPRNDKKTSTDER
jgi:DNA-binding transcriptional MerR regulator